MCVLKSNIKGFLSGFVGLLSVLFYLAIFLYFLSQNSIPFKAVEGVLLTIKNIFYTLAA